MSTHKSLKLGNNLVGRRSVLSRIERIKKLQERGKWSEGDSVFGRRGSVDLLSGFARSA